MTNTVLILGAGGKFGGQCAKTFAAAGWTVRRFDRKSQDMTQAAMGADVIVNGLNPPNYHNWDEIIPQITKDVIAAAKASGATVILPGNVYPFDDRPGVWDENTPHQPNSRKGEIRKQMEAAYRAAAKDGVQTINLRAGDIIDPDSSETMMRIVLFKDLAKGKMAYPGRTDIPHSWCYTPDFARAALALAKKRDSLNRYEDIPFPGQTMSADDIRAIVQNFLHKPLKVRNLPWWLLKISSPFWELARELNEMRYLWNTPHELSGEKLRALLPDFEFTTPQQAIANSLPFNINPDKTVVASRLAV